MISVHQRLNTAMYHLYNRRSGAAQALRENGVYREIKARKHGYNAARPVSWKKRHGCQAGMQEGRLTQSGQWEGASRRIEMAKKAVNAGVLFFCRSRCPKLGRDFWARLTAPLRWMSSTRSGAGGGGLAPPPYSFSAIDWKLLETFSASFFYFNLLCTPWPECFLDLSTQESITLSFFPYKSSPLLIFKGQITPPLFPHSLQHASSLHSSHKN